MDWTPGTSLPVLEIGPLTTEMFVRWCAAAEDYHAIHYDLHYAKERGLPDVVMAGPHKLALCCRLLYSVLGTGGVIRRIKVRYTGMDVPGDVLQFGGTVEAVEETEGGRVAFVRLHARNNRDVVTVQGEAEVFLAD